MKRISLVALLAVIAVACCSVPAQSQPLLGQNELLLSQSDGIRAKECPGCRTLNPLDAKYCSHCGYDFINWKPASGAQTAPNAQYKSTTGPKKSPAASFLLSFLLLPGAGQYYNGQPVKGTIQAVGAIAGAVMVIIEAPSEEYVTYMYYDSYYDDYYERGYWKKTGNEALFIVGLSALGVMKLWSCIDAPVTSSRLNRERGYTGLGRPQLLLEVKPSSVRHGGTPILLGENHQPKPGMNLVAGLEYSF